MIPARDSNNDVPRMETKMSSKPKTTGTTEIKQSSTEVGKGERPVDKSAREQEIQRRAYEIYLERGELPGHDLDDWLQAERELSVNEFNFIPRVKDKT